MLQSKLVFNALHFTHIFTSHHQITQSQDFTAVQYKQYTIYNTNNKIHIYSGITSSRVLNGELYTQRF